MLKRQIQEIIRIIEESNVNEVEVSTWWGRKIRVAKHAAGSGGGIPAGSTPAESAILGDVLRQQISAQGEKPDTAKEPANLHKVLAPIVGTFYSSASPDSPPYITVGDTVTKGQIICIIEAMKIMNEIECDTSGKVTEILVDNASPVEFNQALVVVDPR